MFMLPPYDRRVEIGRFLKLSRALGARIAHEEVEGGSTILAT
jgi:hypothetical protein